MARGLPYCLSLTEGLIFLTTPEVGSRIPIDRRREDKAAPADIEDTLRSGGASARIRQDVGSEKRVD